MRPANCSTHIFTDVPSSIAAAQAATIFVAIHGANVPNAFFMRPTRAVIEVMHPDWAHRHNWMLEQDPTHQLIYFGLVVEASNWTPGLYEQQQKDAGLPPYNGNGAVRDRNVHLRLAYA
ncbi:hypothetical protein D9Q98_003861 [Chlorella vulgaris]|uniref:Uncharacterized protein n=1 Tax=Chlorella vulgaris TaxID=3077 RepID=A0A9D4TR67_CHLVU|nr:hypothetical protein D9Q98_003861 [Chlorella vulgaris]